MRRLLPCVPAAALLAMGFFSLSLSAQETPLNPAPPNPHWRDDACALCHTEDPPTTIAPARWEALCGQCHDLDSINAQVHPFAIQPGALAPRMRANDVPLVEGRLSCASCHDLSDHCQVNRSAQRSNPSFLRGPGGGDLVSLCFLCHDDAPFIRSDPHVQMLPSGRRDDEKCLMCHEEIPEALGSGAHLRAPARVVCAACHVQENHPSGYDHSVIARPETIRAMLHADTGGRLEGMTPSQIERYLETHDVGTLRLPLGENSEITCFTCHTPHDPAAVPSEAALFNSGEPYPDRLRMEPGPLCQACHNL